MKLYEQSIPGAGIDWWEEQTIESRNRSKYIQEIRIYKKLIYIYNVTLYQWTKWFIQ